MSASTKCAMAGVSLWAVMAVVFLASAHLLFPDVKGELHPVFDTKTGQPITSLDTEAEARGIIAGTVALDPAGGPVTLTGTDGSHYSSPPEKVADALATGAYSLLSREDSDRRAIEKFKKYHAANIDILKCVLAALFICGLTLFVPSIWCALWWLYRLLVTEIRRPFGTVEASTGAGIGSSAARASSAPVARIEGDRRLLLFRTIIPVGFALLFVVVDHIILSNQIENAKSEAIEEAGDLDRTDVKDSCLK